MESMRLVTAGFTAGLCLLQLAQHVIIPLRARDPSWRPGQRAAYTLAQTGLPAIAVTGKKAEHAALISLGAAEVMDRQEFLADSEKQLLPAHWASAIDILGGKALSVAVK